MMLSSEMVVERREILIASQAGRHRDAPYSATDVPTVSLQVAIKSDQCETFRNVWGIFSRFDKIPAAAPHGTPRNTTKHFEFKAKPNAFGSRDCHLPVRRMNLFRATRGRIVLNAMQSIRNDFCDHLAASSHRKSNHVP